MEWQFKRVAGPLGFTEGPVWDGSGVLFTDIPNQRVMRFDADSGDCVVYREKTGAANGLKLDDRGRLYACEMRERRLVRYAADGIDVVASHYQGGRFNSPNDLAIESGQIWFTDPYYDSAWDTDESSLELDHRSVYRVSLSGNGVVDRVTRDTTNPNGLLVSPEGDVLYVAQSDFDGARELRAYPIRDDGTTGEHDVLHEFTPHRGIDGMCLDDAGNIVATAGWEESGPGPLLYVFDPSGRVVETHESPDPRPTNCCFGDDDLKSLYVTGSNGCLYRARTDRVGHLGPPKTGLERDRSGKSR
jgi:gluconolactonase